MNQKQSPSMGGIERLNEAIRPWTNSAGVTPIWEKGALQLKDTQTGKVGTVVSFDRGFWDLYDKSPEFLKENAIASIRLDIELRYRPASAIDAEDVHIPNSYVTAA